MQIYTCDSCGARLTEAQLEQGKAVESEGYVYCSRCADELGLEPEGEYYDDYAPGEPQAYAPSRGLNVKLLAGVTVGAVVLGAVVGLLLLTKRDEKPRRRDALAVRLPAPRERELPPPEAVPPEEPEVARRAEPESPREGIVPPPGRGAGEPAAEDSTLVAGFEEGGYRFDCGPAAVAKRLGEGAARGEGVLALLKREKSTSGTDAFVRVTFPASVDLSGYNKLGLWLRSSGVKNEFRLALTAAGRRSILPPVGEMTLGGEWKWYEFLLAGERSAVEGLLFYFNEMSEPLAYRVYLDEVRAYEKAGAAPAAAAVAVAAAPAAAGGKVLSAARPGGNELYKYDFDGAKPLVWREGELAGPGRSGAGKCLKSVVHMSGEERYENVRLHFEPSLKVESGMVAFFSYKLEKSARLSVACDSRARGGKVRRRFRDLKPGEWGTVRFLLTDLVTEDGDNCAVGDDLSTFAIFAGGRDQDRKVYVDDFVIAAEEPRLLLAGLEAGLGGAVSRYRHAIIDSAEAARVGAKGLAITVKPGDSRHQASRVEFPVAEGDLGRFTHVSVWLGGEGFTKLRAAVELKDRADKHQVVGSFNYGPDWKRHVLELKDTPRSDVKALAFYFNNTSKGWPESFRVYLDELALHVGPPGPEEAAPAPSAVAQEAEPASRLDVTGGGEVLLANDFEDGAGPFSGGKITRTNTYRSSRASFKATVDLKREFYSCRISLDKWSVGKKNEKGIFELGEETIIAFAYYLDGAQSVTLMSWFEEKKENFRYDLRKLPQKTWTLAQVRYLDFRSNDSKSKEKPKSGDWPQNLSWMAGKAGTDCTLMIDDVVMCNGRIPGDIGKTLKTRLDKKRETVADPRKDGYYMTMEMIDGLAEKLKDGKAAKKKLAVLGDRLAASNYFLAPLAKPGKRLDPKNGYKFIPKMALAQATKKLSSYRKRDALKKALDRYKPEIVVVLAGYNDLKRGLPMDEVRTEYSYICECCLEAGAVPVLITVPVRAGMRNELGGLATGYSEAAFNTAKTLQVPMIDAHSWLNAEGRSPRKYFSSTGLKQPAYDEINALFAEVYDRLEKYVLARGE